ncbi:MAG: acyl-CoA dehydrogenase [Cycloclasticus sp. symbiont of Poecilosclerida sp. M]|nr:MAG: acyl-CoA dehydrogenase [Cycloclasticus sp. symbiont of Poecilosclerida sp. M]
MSELAQLIEESASRLFERFSDSDAALEMEAGGFPEQTWQEFVADGWLTTMLDEEKGGSGLGFSGGCLLMRLAGYHAVPLPVAESLLANYLATEAGFKPNDELLVPAVLLQTVQTKQVTLQHVPWARHASAVVVVFSKNKQTHVSVIARENLSVEYGQNMAGEPRDEVTFDADLLRYSEILEYISIEKLLSWLSLARASQISGALQRVLERTVEFANERTQFGRQIGKFQAVQQQIAVQAEMTYATVCAVDVAIEYLASPHEKDLIACAKITAGEAAGYAAKTAHAVHAAIGFTQEYPLQLSTRRLWSWRDEYGNEAQWAAKLGENCMDLETDNLWQWLTTHTG